MSAKPRAMLRSIGLEHGQRREKPIRQFAPVADDFAGEE